MSSDRVLYMITGAFVVKPQAFLHTRKIVSHLFSKKQNSIKDFLRGSLIAIAFSTATAMRPAAHMTLPNMWLAENVDAINRLEASFLHEQVKHIATNWSLPSIKALESPQLQPLVQGQENRIVEVLIALFLAVSL